MTSSIFFGGSVLAAVIAGAIALFAPCCISVMLPAYFASSFPNRRLLVAMTFLFAAGIATIILPIAMGASVLQRLLTAQHTAIYVTGGLIWLALGLGTAYVFGMVAPLFAIALLWERLGGRVSRLFRPRAFTWRLGPLRRTLTATNLASGLLLELIGGGMLWVGLQYSSMPPLADWQEQFAVGLQHVGQVITNTLTWLPNWAGAAILLALIGGLAWYALRQIGAHADEGDGSEGTESARETETPLVQTQEEPVEHQESTHTAGAEEHYHASKEEHRASKEGSLFS